VTGAVTGHRTGAVTGGVSGHRTGPEPPTRRRYDNTLRRERAAQTRDRIVAAGAEVVQQSSIRDWRALTIRGVAERAGVNERTVFRHFPNERALRDAVMHSLEQRAGVDLAGLQLDGIAEATARIFRLVASYPPDPRPALDPTLADASERQHDALLTAVAGRTARWSAADRTVTAAVFDVLWAVSSYERMVVDWHLPEEEVIRGIRWAITLLQEAVADGRRPPRVGARTGASRPSSGDHVR
jgi:AcrR family transcriptional regulator